MEMNYLMGAAGAVAELLRIGQRFRNRAKSKHPIVHGYKRVKTWQAKYGFRGANSIFEKGILTRIGAKK